MIFPKSITQELAEEVGWHIGDGSMNFYNNRGKKKGIYQLRGHIEDDKPHYINRIKPLFRSLFNIDISLREMPSTRVFGFQIWSDDLVKFKQKLGLPLGKKYDISIPGDFLKNNDLKINVLRGIFDTDGGIYLEKKNNKLYPLCYITTISKMLSKQLHSLLKDFKIHSTVTSYFIQRGNRKRHYRVNIRGLKECGTFMEKVASANPKHVDKYIKFNNSKSL